jgi:hypothetical protein
MLVLNIETSFHYFTNLGWDGLIRVRLFIPWLSQNTWLWLHFGYEKAETNGTMFYRNQTELIKLDIHSLPLDLKTKGPIMLDKVYNCCWYFRILRRFNCRWKSQQRQTRIQNLWMWPNTFANCVLITDDCERHR